MKITFRKTGNIEINPENEMEIYTLNSFLKSYYKKQTKIIIYGDILETIKTEIEYNKGK